MLSTIRSSSGGDDGRNSSGDDDDTVEDNVVENSPVVDLDGSGGPSHDVSLEIQTSDDDDDATPEINGGAGIDWTVRARTL